ncbi:hypothetical protein CRUP_017424 [Coryphaenoides rupestris]|nr:hypothetical protein CRUP_017424 [Coryphaenoides rupestris]
MCGGGREVEDVRTLETWGTTPGAGETTMRDLDPRDLDPSQNTLDHPGSIQLASNSLGPIRKLRSTILSSSRTSVAVRPSLQWAWTMVLMATEQPMGLSLASDVKRQIWESSMVDHILNWAFHCSTDTDEFPRTRQRFLTGNTMTPERARPLPNILRRLFSWYGRSTAVGFRSMLMSGFTLKMSSGTCKEDEVTSVAWELDASPEHPGFSCNDLEIWRAEIATVSDDRVLQKVLDHLREGTLHKVLHDVGGLQPHADGGIQRSFAPYSSSLVESSSTCFPAAAGTSWASEPPASSSSSSSS